MDVYVFILYIYICTCGICIYIYMYKGTLTATYSTEKADAAQLPFFKRWGGVKQSNCCLRRLNRPRLSAGPEVKVFFGLLRSATTCGSRQTDCSGRGQHERHSRPLVCAGPLPVY